MPHWKPARYNLCLLQGIPYRKQQRSSSKLVVSHVPDDGLDAGYIPPPPPRVTRPRRARAALHDVGVEDVSHHSSGTDSHSSSSSSSSNSIGNDSDSDSNASSSSGEADDGSADAAPAHPPLTQVGGSSGSGGLGRDAITVAGRVLNSRDGNFDFGHCHMTQTFKEMIPKGWEMKCNHPLHTVAGQCRLHRQSTTRTRDEDTTVRYLLHWAVLGAVVDTREEHMGDVVTRVNADLEASSLPVGFEPVAQFFDSDGDPVEYQKRARLGA